MSVIKESKDKSITHNKDISNTSNTSNTSNFEKQASQNPMRKRSKKKRIIKSKVIKSPNSPELIKSKITKKVIKGYKYDWDSIRTQFIEGIIDPENPNEREYVSLKELSLRNNVPYTRIREQSSIESWTDNKNMHQMAFAKERQRRRIVELSKESIEFDTKALNIAKMGTAIISARLSEIVKEIKLHKELKEEVEKAKENGELIDFELYQRLFSTAIDAKELDMLARAMQTWQIIGQKALGTDIIKHELQIEGNVDIDIRALSITAELNRDDPDRLAALIKAIQEVGLTDVDIIQNSDQEILEIEATVVGEENNEEK